MEYFIPQLSGGKGDLIPLFGGGCWAVNRFLQAKLCQQSVPTLLRAFSYCVQVFTRARGEKPQTVAAYL